MPAAHPAPHALQDQTGRRRVDRREMKCPALVSRPLCPAVCRWPCWFLPSPRLGFSISHTRWWCLCWGSCPDFGVFSVRALGLPPLDPLPGFPCSALRGGGRALPRPTGGNWGIFFPPL